MQTAADGAASDSGAAAEAGPTLMKSASTKDGRVTVPVAGRLTLYEVMKPIGKGKFSTVFRARRKDDGIIVALKKIQIFDMMDENSREKCLKEIGLVQSLDHPNIIKHFDSFIENNELHLVFEYAEAGDLKRQLRKAQERQARFDERVIWKYFSQIARALKHMHDRRVMHRDLKPANVFLTLNGTVKVGDLGLGRAFSDATIEAHSKVGTPLYMSPEVLRGKGYEWRSDIWSLGCVLYELAMLRSPFKEEGLDLYGLFQKITKGNYPSISDVYSFELRDLAGRMLSLDPEARPDMVEVCAIAEEMRERTQRARAALLEQRKQQQEAQQAQAAQQAQQAEAAALAKQQQEEAAAAAADAEAQRAAQQQQEQQHEQQQPYAEAKEEEEAEGAAGAARGDEEEGKQARPDEHEGKAAAAAAVRMPLATGMHVPEGIPKEEAEALAQAQAKALAEVAERATATAQMRAAVEERQKQLRLESEREGHARREQSQDQKRAAQELAQQMAAASANAAAAREGAVGNGNSPTAQQAHRPHGVHEVRRPHHRGRRGSRSSARRPSQHRLRGTVSPDGNGGVQEHDDGHRRSSLPSERMTAVTHHEEGPTGEAPVAVPQPQQPHERQQQMEGKHAEEAAARAEPTAQPVQHPHRLGMHNGAGGSAGAAEAARRRGRISVAAKGQALPLCDELMETLKLLDYESRFMEERGGVPWCNVYFAVSFSKPGKARGSRRGAMALGVSAYQQLQDFLALSEWLLSLIVHSSGPLIDRNGNPSSACAAILSEMGKLQAPAELLSSVTPQSLTQGSGAATCKVLLWLAKAALVEEGWQWHSPDYSAAADELEEDAIDDDMLVEEPGASMVEEEDEIMYGGVVEERMLGASADGTKQAEDVAVLKPQVDNKAWLEEFERVKPKLRVHSDGVVTSEWRAHVEGLLKHGSTLASAADGVPDKSGHRHRRKGRHSSSAEADSHSMDALRKIAASCSAALERVQRAEKRMNGTPNIAGLREEYQAAANAQTEFEAQAAARQEKVTALTQQFNSVLDSADAVSEQLSGRGSSMSDTAPLHNIRKALRALEKETGTLDARVGVALQQVERFRMRKIMAKADRQRERGKFGGFDQSFAQSMSSSWAVSGIEHSDSDQD